MSATSRKRTEQGQGLAWLGSRWSPRIGRFFFSSRGFLFFFYHHRRWARRRAVVSRSQGGGLAFRARLYSRAHWRPFFFCRHPCAQGPSPFRTALSLPLRPTNSTRRDTDDVEEEERQQEFGPGPFLSGRRGRGCAWGDPRTSKEGFWWLAERLQPLALGTAHVRVR